jgi:hypothetical protein
MKYMLLCYDDEKHWADAGVEGMEKAMQQALGIVEDLQSKGRFIDCAPLEPAWEAASVRVRDGKPIVTSGPFAETREVLGGYYIIDVPSLDEAIEIAARHPGAPHGAVEIRPILEIPGLPE